MNDKLFDKKLKAALDNLEAPFDPTSWVALEQRLNAPFTEEQPAPVDAVDKAVFRTLKRLEAPYQSAHWNMLANRMTLAARQRRRVWVAKSLEAAIFLLLLLNLDGFLGGGTSAPQQPVAPPQTPKNNRLQAEAPASRSHKGASFVPGSLLENGISRDGENWASILPFSLQDIDGQNFEEIIALTQDGQIVAPASQNLLESAPEVWSSLADLMTLPILPRQLVERANVSPYAGSTVHVKAPKQHRFYAATFASLDQNYVRSEGYSNISSGHGGGVAIGARIGKWGVEAGLSYNRRQYQPKKEVEIYDITPNGLYGSFAKSVDADVVAVPVKITRRITQFGQTSVHATAGVTANFAVDKSYQYASVFYPAPSASGPSNTDQKPKLRKNGQGVLENGSLGGNVYASADVGMRVEQPIGRHFAAFVEPTYRQAIGKKGIGPNPAKVNTFSVQAGVLATM